MGEKITQTCPGCGETVEYEFTPQPEGGDIVMFEPGQHGKGCLIAPHVLEFLSGADKAPQV
jgi:hypothetical protein